MLSPSPSSTPEIGVLGALQRAGAVQRPRRAGDVRDRDVDRRLDPAQRRRTHRRPAPSRANSAGGMKWLASCISDAGSCLVAFLRGAHRLVDAAQAARSGRVRRWEARRASPRPGCRNVPSLLGGADRDRHERDQRLVRELAPFGQPAAKRGRADRHHDVVDGASIGVLDRLDLIQRRASRTRPGGEPEIRPWKRVRGAVSSRPSGSTAARRVRGIMRLHPPAGARDRLHPGQRSDRGHSVEVRQRPSAPRGARASGWRHIPASPRASISSSPG